jgi:hypothetical protein
LTWQLVHLLGVESAMLCFQKYGQMIWDSILSWMATIGMEQ